MSENDGKFKPGNQMAVGHGRPVDSGKQLVKDLVWEKINNIVEMVFNMPESRLQEYIKANRGEALEDEEGRESFTGPLQLSRAERLYLENSTNLAVIEALLDRVIGKTLALDNASQRDPIIERLYKLGPGGVNKEIDALIEAREIINAEYKQLDASEETD